MNRLQTALEEALADGPNQVVAEVISRKLAACGVSLSERERKQLLERVRAGTVEDLRLRRWPWWVKRDVTVEITPAEAEVIHDRYVEFLTDTVPLLIESTIEDLSLRILATLRAELPSRLKQDARERRGFERRLHDRWGKALGLLRMALTLSREFGAGVPAAVGQIPGFHSPQLLGVLTRLHARACQVADEMVCLLEAGFADGAMARWRTVHEIAIVGFLLGTHGEKLAQRYVEHEVVEAFRAALEYRGCVDRLNCEPMADSEFEAIEKAHDDAIRRYGKSFGCSYGWAAEAVGISRPTVKDLERAAGIDHLRPYYRMASHNVHANPKGVFFKLGLMDESDLLLAGASNAGLADPGHSAAISLLHVSVALGLVEPSLDSLIGLRILSRLTDEIGEAFGDANRRLAEDAGGQGIRTC